MKTNTKLSGLGLESTRHGTPAFIHHGASVKKIVPHNSSLWKSLKKSASAFHNVPIYSERSFEGLEFFMPPFTF
jgi:hypothetical protein